MSQERLGILAPMLWSPQLTETVIITLVDVQIVATVKFIVLTGQPQNTTLKSTLINSFTVIFETGVTQINLHKLRTVLPLNSVPMLTNYQ